MCAIDYTTVKRNEVQFQLRQSDLVAHPSRSAPSHFAPSTSALSSSSGDVTLGDIMLQLQCMDARLYTLSTELYQVNVRVGHIARRQASMGAYASEASPLPPPLIASNFEDKDDDNGGDDDASNDDDGNASSIDEMST